MKSESFLTLHRQQSTTMFKTQKDSKDIVNVVRETFGIQP